MHVHGTFRDKMVVYSSVFDGCHVINFSNSLHILNMIFSAKARIARKTGGLSSPARACYLLAP